MTSSHFNLVRATPDSLISMDRMASWSPQEINVFLKAMIAAIQNRSSFFSRIKDEDYYVFLGIHEEAYLLSGRYVRFFSVSVPSVDILRKRFLREGISHVEKLAMSQAIDSAFDECYMDACVSIGIYGHTIEKLCEVYSVTNETIEFLLERVKFIIELKYDDLRCAITVGEGASAFEKIMNYKSQERFLQTELQRRIS